jgi:hypothetical protein
VAEHLLAVCHEIAEQHAAAVQRARAAGGRRVVHPNPFWEEHGTTFMDPDGNQLMLVDMPWRAGSELDVGHAVPGRSEREDCNRGQNGQRLEHLSGIDRRGFDWVRIPTSDADERTGRSQNHVGGHE